VGGRDPIDLYIEAPNRIGVIFFYFKRDGGSFAAKLKDFIARLPSNLRTVLIISNRQPSPRISEVITTANSSTQIHWITWEGNPHDDGLADYVAHYLLTSES
jgi:hypothetical protein